MRDDDELLRTRSLSGMPRQPRATCRSTTHIAQFAQELMELAREPLQKREQHEPAWGASFRALFGGMVGRVRDRDENRNVYSVGQNGIQDDPQKEEREIVLSVEGPEAPPVHRGEVTHLGKGRPGRDGPDLSLTPDYYLLP